ncbi:MAG: helix-turn-helix domain-containing protein [Oscillospiraceae bacterium]
MDNFDYPAIGQRIKQLRKRKGLNQTELAQMLKKSLRTVQKYETGEIEVSIAVVNQIADLLDTTLNLYPLGMNPVQRTDQNAFRRDGLPL